MVGIIGKVQQQLKQYRLFICSVTSNILNCYFRFKIYSRKALVVFSRGLSDNNRYVGTFLFILFLKTVLSQSFVKPESLKKWHNFIFLYLF